VYRQLRVRPGLRGDVGEGRAQFLAHGRSLCVADHRPSQQCTGRL